MRSLSRWLAMGLLGVLGWGVYEDAHQHVTALEVYLTQDGVSIRDGQRFWSSSASDPLHAAVLADWMGYTWWYWGRERVMPLCTEGAAALSPRVSCLATGVVRVTPGMLIITRTPDWQQLRVVPASLQSDFLALLSSAPESLPLPSTALFYSPPLTPPAEAGAIPLLSGSHALLTAHAPGWTVRYEAPEGF
ncbi:hypothetical protein H6771_00205 [Candidatus Peribacteria bacterium]|nr:hypothetical protein [Candidatus Peribacteria bacterium]